MSDIINEKRKFSFSVTKDEDIEKIKNIGAALSTEDRIKIIKLVSVRPMTLSELSRELGIAVSTVSFHIDALVRSQLISVSYQPGIKGHTKLCSKAIDNLSISFDIKESVTDESNTYFEEMPVGNYVDAVVEAPCGIAGNTGVIEDVDTPELLFSPRRTEAELLWFQSGYVSYNFPSKALRQPNCYKSISFSMELCSETIYCKNNWPSDITVWINGIEIATYTSPGDFGGRRGKYTPKYWYINSTQYGILKKFTVNEVGSYIDGELVNRNVKFSDLKLSEGQYVKLTVGIKDDAVHKGGVNIFGKKFGDHQQAIIMTLQS